VIGWTELSEEAQYVCWEALSLLAAERKTGDRSTVNQLWRLCSMDGIVTTGCTQ
jgi:hypothetical protein